MAVLVEAKSVVIRRDVIAARYPGGWDAFVVTIPNRQWCADDHLARVGFMIRADAINFTSKLSDAGLTFTDADRNFVDFAVIDQVDGWPARPAPWLGYGMVPVTGGMVLACWMRGVPQGDLAVPTGWTYEKSLYPSYAKNGVPDPRDFKFLWRLRTIDIFRHGPTGTLRYVGRAYPTSSPIPDGFESPTVGEVAELAIELHAGGNYADALSIFLSLVRHQPDSAEVLSAVSDCEAKLGKFDAALSAATAALALDPNYAEAWANLGNALAGLNDIVAATEAWRKALQLDPNCADARAGLHQIV